MKNKPDKVYFQICDDKDYIEEDFKDFKQLDTENITYCFEKVFNCDLEYFSKEFVLEFAKYIIGDCSKFNGIAKTENMYFYEFNKIKP